MWMRLAILSVIASLAFFSCAKRPPPPEAQTLEAQDFDLRRKEAHLYLPDEYTNYLNRIKQAKDTLFRENAKLPWFRKYTEIELTFQEILKEGDRIRREALRRKETRANSILNYLLEFKNRIQKIRNLSRMINGGQSARLILLRAELRLREVELQHLKENFEAAEKMLPDIAFYVKDTEDLVFSYLNRYQDQTLIEEWKKWVEEALSASKQNNSLAVIVSKIDRRLVLYRSGVPYKSFEISLGRNGFSAKLHAGDYATPEGKYRIVKKLSSGLYHKSLLLDFPNEEDKERFEHNRKRGLIPAGVGIGGMIEIHGGGNDSITDGCISLDDQDLDKIFDLVPVGTPVTIVGALDNIRHILKE